jgi:ATP-dependent DNA helicase RecG
MTYSGSDILSVVKNGENSFVEFKEKNVRAESIAKELAAFLNFEGGAIYIGISDNGQILGVDDDREYEEWVMNICRNSVYPPVIPAYEEIGIGDRKVIRIQVGKGTSKPYSTTGNNRYYIRVGSTSREPSQQELIRLLQESNQLHYEITPVFNTSVKDISKGRLQDYFEKRGINIEHYDQQELETFLYNTEILVEVNETRHVSLAGILFFAKDTGNWLRNAGVQLVKFDGNDVTDRITDRKDVEGNLLETIDKAVDFINLYNPIAEEFKGIRRIDIQDYNKRVVRELIVNAFAHRDWSLEGAKVRVYVFRDFIEVRSPGKIPNTLTLDRIKAGISYYRNPLIMQILVDYGYADKIGRGIMSVIKYHKENKLRIPDFEECGFEFRVRVWKQLFSE